MQKILFILLLFLVSSQRLSAITDTSNFLHFNLDNGFPSNNVYSLLQDRHGYIWFATDNGVVKYNGYTFKIFNTNNGLPSSDVWQLFEDFTGRIWLNSYTYKIGYLEDDVYKDIGISVSNKSWARNICDNGKIVSFALDINGKTSMVVLYNGQLFVVPVKVFDKAPYKAVYFLSNDLFYRIDEWYKVNSFDLSGRRPKEVYEGGGSATLGRVAVGTNNDLYANYFSSNEIRYIDLKNGDVKIVDLEKDCGAESNEHFYNASIYHCNGKDRKTVFITNSKFYFFDTLFNFLGSKMISDLVPGTAQASFYYTDKSDNRWIATRENGVWKLPAIPVFFKKERSEVLAGSINVGMVDSLSYWWDEKQALLFEVYGKEFKNAIPFNKGDKVRQVVGNAANLYIVRNSKMHVYDRKLKTLRELVNADTKFSLYGFPAIEKTHRSAAIYSVANNIFLWENRIYQLQQQMAGCWNLYADSVVIEKISDERFGSIYHDNHRRKVWLYNAQKILIIDLLSKGRVLIDGKQLEALGINNIKRIETDSKGNIYLQANNEVFVYRPSLNNLKKLQLNINIGDGMFRVYNDRLFLTDKFGIACLRIVDGKVKEVKVVPNEGAKYYNKVYDLFFDQLENLYLVTDKGLYSSHYDSLNNNPSFDPGGKDFFTLISREPFVKTIKENDTLYFDQSAQKLSFDVINFYGKGDPVISYTVSGDNVMLKGDGDIFIEGLSPGTYHKVDCKIKDELWQSRTFSFFVYRQPYWYQTRNWQIVIWSTAIISILGVILIIILLTRHSVAKKNEKRRAQTELELRAIHSQINPHFIFNTLSTALYFINKKRFDDAYVHVSKFSRLLRSYLKASHDRYTILGDEIRMLRNYIELQQTRFEQKFIYRIEIDNKIPVNNIQIPSLLLQPLIENAINHGLFHLEGNGELILKFQQGADNTELICVIEDNGVGRAKAKEINDASSTKDSYGTKLTNQLLEVFREYEHMDIEMNYIDKEPPLSGTIITLTIKRVRYIA